MDDTFGRATAYLILIFGLFFLAPVILFLNADLSNRSYVNQTLSQFVENACSSGTISKADYQQLVSRLSNSGNSYVIRIEHRSKVIVPYGTDEYRTTYKTYVLSDMFAEWDGYGEDLEPDTSDDVSGHDHYMKSGDYLTMTVRSTNDTLGSRFYGLITGRPNGFKLVVSAGGTVGGDTT